MRPSQINPNEFEVAILERIAQTASAISAKFAELHVLSREFTGAGSYTTFKVTDSARESIDESYPLRSLILVPGVPIGTGAGLFCKQGAPALLETYTFGSELWDGVYAGFFI